MDAMPSKAFSLRPKTRPGAQTVQKSLVAGILVVHPDLDRSPGISSPRTARLTASTSGPRQSYPSGLLPAPTTHLLPILRLVRTAPPSTPVSTLPPSLPSSSSSSSSRSTRRPVGPLALAGGWVRAGQRSRSAGWLRRSGLVGGGWGPAGVVQLHEGVGRAARTSGSVAAGSAPAAGAGAASAVAAATPPVGCFLALK